VLDQENRSLARRALGEALVKDFVARVRGPVLQPGDPGYDVARQVWNGLIDRRPALIARCLGPADVIQAVNFAREHELVISIRGGGHNVAGNAVNDDGIVIDLSLMRGVHVDPRAHTARAQGGALLADLDRETQLFGLATPAGNVSATGVAGLTLHGGLGYLRGKHGLSIDNLLSVDIVTADGELRTASATENPDLFWAVRGAGSNFGVVTSFEFRLHPVGPTVLFCAPFYAIENASHVLSVWRDFSLQAPDEFSSFVALVNVPPGPPFPPDLHGRTVTIVVGMYCGPIAEGERVIEPLRTLATPLLDLSGPLPYVAVQSAFDALFPPGQLYHWKSLYLDTLGEAEIGTLLRYTGTRPSPMSYLSVWYQGGAVSRLGVGDTAFPHRDKRFMITCDAIWTNPAETGPNAAWAREAWTAMREFSSGALYLNFPGFGEDADRDSLVRAGYGPNYERLVQLKNRYDPTNLFRMNQNIRPTV